MKRATVCGALVRRAPFALVVLAAAGLTLAAAAQSATPPRLVGSYQTLSHVLAQTQNGGANPAGYSAVRTWRFVRKCTRATCTTTLIRPTITPGGTGANAYSLHVAPDGSYTGARDFSEYCYSAGGPPIKVLPTGSAVEHVVITIRPTETRAGKVLAYDGTMIFTARPTVSGRAEGCIIHAFESESIESPA